PLLEEVERVARAVGHRALGAGDVRGVVVVDVGVLDQHPVVTGRERDAVDRRRVAAGDGDRLVLHVGGGGLEGAGRSGHALGPGGALGPLIAGAARVALRAGLAREPLRALLAARAGRTCVSARATLAGALAATAAAASLCGAVGERSGGRVGAPAERDAEGEERDDQGRRRPLAPKTSE